MSSVKKLKDTLTPARKFRQNVVPPNCNSPIYNPAKDGRKTPIFLTAERFARRSKIEAYMEILTSSNKASAFPLQRIKPIADIFAVATCGVAMNMVISGIEQACLRKNKMSLMTLLLPQNGSLSRNIAASACVDHGR